MVALLALRDLLARQSLTDGQKVVLLRIGAGILAPHLKKKNDFFLARFLTFRITPLFFG